MTLERVQRTAAAAGALGLLLLATPTYAQTASTSAKEPTMTLGQVQVTSPPAAMPRATTEDVSIRPFRFTAPQAALDDLRRRVKATQSPAPARGDPARAPRRAPRYEHVSDRR